MVAAKKEEPATATTHTFTLSLEPESSAPNGFHVVIKNVERFWAKVKKDDHIQFALDDSDPKLHGAKVKILFVPDSAGPFPLENHTVTTTNPQLVMNPTRDFKAECFITTSDGKEYGYLGDDGGRPCTTPGCL